MTRKSRTRRVKLNVPSDLFGIYATLNRGMPDADFDSLFAKSALYEACMEIHLSLARRITKQCEHSCDAEVKEPKKLH